MAKITDQAQLNLSTQASSGTPDGEIFVDTALKQVELIVFGNLDDTSPGATSGAAGQAVYSKLKSLWKSNNTLNKFKFPLKAFRDGEELQWINGWAPMNAQTRQLLRDCGVTESVGAEAGDEYMCIVSLGQHDAVGDQSYFQQVAGFSATVSNFDKTGNVNELVLIYDASGPTDLRSFFKAFLRIEAKTLFDGNLLVDQSLTTLKPIVYKMQLENTTDLNIGETDANIAANAPYTGMTVTYLKGSGFTTFDGNSVVYPAGAVVKDSTGRWFFTPAGGTSGGAGTTTASDTGILDWESYAGEEEIGAGSGNWIVGNRILEGNNGTKQQIYEFSHWSMRQVGDINANNLGAPNQNAYGTVNGKNAVELCGFVGPDLISNPGVIIRSFNTNDTNNIKQSGITVDGGGLDSEDVPVASTVTSYPRVSAWTFEFSQNIVDAVDADTRAVLYFQNDDPPGDNLGNDFDTASAVIVNRNAGTPIDFLVSAASMPEDYDYDGNVQRGAGSAGTDVPVALQLTGLGDFENQFYLFTIGDATGVTVSINANDERNYAA